MSIVLDVNVQKAFPQSFPSNMNHPYGIHCDMWDENGKTNALSVNFFLSRSAARNPENNPVITTYVDWSFIGKNYLNTNDQVEKLFDIWLTWVRDEIEAMQLEEKHYIFDLDLEWLVDHYDLLPDDLFALLQDHI